MNCTERKPALRLRPRNVQISLCIRADISASFLLVVWIVYNIYKLVSHWNATNSRLVGDNALRYKRDFLTIFTLRSYWKLWSQHKCNIIDDTRIIVVRHSRECFTTIMRYSCVHLTTVVRHSCDCACLSRQS